MLFRGMALQPVQGGEGVAQVRKGGFRAYNGDEDQSPTWIAGGRQAGQPLQE